MAIRAMPAARALNMRRLAPQTAARASNTKKSARIPPSATAPPLAITSSLPRPKELATTVPMFVRPPDTARSAMKAAAAPQAMANGRENQPSRIRSAPIAANTHTAKADTNIIALGARKYFVPGTRSMTSLKNGVKPPRDHSSDTMRTPSMKRLNERDMAAAVPRAPIAAVASMMTAAPRYSLCRWMLLRPQYASRMPVNSGRYMLTSSSGGIEYDAAKSSDVPPARGDSGMYLMNG